MWSSLHAMISSFVFFVAQIPFGNKSSIPSVISLKLYPEMLKHANRSLSILIINYVDLWVLYYAQVIYYTPADPIFSKWVL